MEQWIKDVVLDPWFGFAFSALLAVIPVIAKWCVVVKFLAASARFTWRAVTWPVRALFTPAEKDGERRHNKDFGPPRERPKSKPRPKPPCPAPPPPTTLDEFVAARERQRIREMADEIDRKILAGTPTDEEPVGILGAVWTEEDEELPDPDFEIKDAQSGLHLSGLDVHAQVMADRRGQRECTLTLDGVLADQIERAYAECTTVRFQERDWIVTDVLHQHFVGGTRPQAIATMREVMPEAIVPLEGPLRETSLQFGALGVSVGEASEALRVLFNSYEPFEVDLSVVPLDAPAPMAKPTENPGTR